MKSQGKPGKAKLLFNVAGFNAAWWACVLGVKYSVPWAGPVTMTIFLLLHFKLMGSGRREMFFIFLVALFGTVVDSLKNSSGFIYYSATIPGVEWLTPIWIIAMWAGFASLINHSLKWLNGRYVLAFAMGALFGPPAYLAGVKLDVLNFSLPVIQSVLILASIWGLSVMLIVWSAEQINHGGTHVQQA